MFASYRRILSLPGALAFTLYGLLARLAMSMSGVSVVAMVAERRGSYALAGAVSAAGLATVAVVMPLLGRLVDRYGQARVAVPATLTASVPLAGLLVCVRLGAPTWTLFVCWAAASTVPNVGGMVRARWTHLLRDDAAGRHLANSLEQALDELCFMTGPVLAVLLCGSLLPEAGLIGAGLLCASGMFLLASRRDTEPPLSGSGGTPDATAPGRTADAHPARSGAPARGRRGLWALLPVFLCTGVVFGALEVTTLACADAGGHRAWAGLLLGLVAAGSCVSGLAFGLLRPRRPARTRLLVGLAAMTGLLLPLPLAGSAGGSPALLALALFAAGSATAPTMISGMTLVQEAVPAHRLNQGMAAAVSAILIGISAGSALGGLVAGQGDPASGYLVLVGAAAAALLVAAAGLRVLRGAGPGTPDGRDLREPSVGAAR
ncbi:MFS transporter [Kitasatospora sp. NBC_01539]|uniref:MFS transporter n=1 Tax=Kitasatospora sp. NBC_01539 TaxID=2903577 RepID=UPI0038601109